jgi:hypothetical protein
LQQRREQSVFEGGTAPVLSANADQEALKLSWTNPSYMFNTGVSSQNVSYVLEIDTAGANFASGVKKSYSIVSDVSKTFTEAGLTPFGWNSDTPMTYDATTNTWVINSIILTADEFKFRANDNWDINLGGDPAKLNYGVEI